MKARFWKVGELAKQTQLTIRTLHYYEEIGLLTPSCRTDSGHRVYSEDDIVRLQQILSLRQLGFALEEIQGCLQRKDFSPLKVVQMHLESLKKEMENQHRLYERLSSLASALRSTETVSVDEFLQTIEVIAMYEKYYTKEQLEELAQRKETLGEEQINKVQEEWPILIASVRKELDKGTDPMDPTVQKLAKRWKELVDMFTGGKPQMEASVGSLYKGEPKVQQQFGLDSAVFQYVSKAMAGLKK